MVCINGAAAHHVHPGDVVILLGYGLLEDAAARSHLPRVVFVEAGNRIVETSHDPGQVPDGHGVLPSGVPLASLR
jgi:aspartate 1-decarboxylase